MKKRFLVTIVTMSMLMTMMFGLVACGGSKDTTSNDVESTEIESTTEASTEVTTEAPTEASTEVTTEAPTEAQTEVQTEIQTEAQVADAEPQTEAVIEAPTEPLTEAPTEATAPTEAPVASANTYNGYELHESKRYPGYYWYNDNGKVMGINSDRTWSSLIGNYDSPIWAYYEGTWNGVTGLYMKPDFHPELNLTATVEDDFDHYVAGAVFHEAKDEKNIGK